jgi:hypothetical protein
MRDHSLPRIITCDSHEGPGGETGLAARPSCLRQVEGEMTPALCLNHKGLGGPFKPSFGLSGVVADPSASLLMNKTCSRLSWVLVEQNRRSLHCASLRSG